MAELIARKSTPAVDGEEVVRAEDVGIWFRRGGRDDFRSHVMNLLHGRRHRPEAFWALEGVSFSAVSGEILGIIGANGAGKYLSQGMKARLSFSVAVEVNPSLLLIDEAHSIEEDRWITLGMVPTGAVLLMVHTFEDVSDKVTVIRVISARHATSQERATYERQ